MPFYKLKSVYGSPLPISLAPIVTIFIHLSLFYQSSHQFEHVLSFMFINYPDPAHLSRSLKKTTFPRDPLFIQTTLHSCHIPNIIHFGISLYRYTNLYCCITASKVTSHTSK